jgi:hypothetical protein
LGCCLSLWLAHPSNAAINDIYPGDYLAAPAGTNALVVYFYDRALEGPYQQGHNARSRDRDTKTIIFLGATYFDVYQTRVAVSASAGKTRQSTTGSASSTNEAVWGNTDPKASVTVWPLQNDKHSLAGNFAHILPLGSYDRGSTQNIGQNRHRSILSFSWAHFLNSRFRIETTAEIAVFQKSKDDLSGILRQKNTEALTLFATYKASSDFSPYIGYQWNTGGEIAVGKNPYGEADRFQRVFVGTKLGLPNNQTLQLRCSRDTEKLTGMRLNREVTVKWTKLF